ncbi:nitroreductase family protein [[Kitasatospora] papulosa]|uniref:nitroreductase family protein n=1 Tax=[Kitasatospora] papulosa TaxID=1464011 RepID=UPI00382C9C08
MSAPRPGRRPDDPLPEPGPGRGPHPAQCTPPDRARPDPADLERLVQAAATTPDHGRLRPWRLVAVSGDKRARLGDALGEAADTPEQARRAASKPLRAPCS